MNKIIITSVLLLSTVLSVVGQNWETTGALSATGSSTYLTAATSLGDDVYAVSLEQVFVHSSDQGVSWTAPTINDPSGTFAYMKGIGGRLYAEMKVNSYDFELVYSVDHGVNWMLDTVGLPNNITKTGKSSVVIKDMLNGYVLAHTHKDVYYKKIKDASWTKSPMNEHAFKDVAAIPGKWIGIGVKKLIESTDNGVSWSEISTSGLPQDFQGSLLSSNGVDRLFLSNKPADGGEDIYFSDNGGSTWVLTNSSGHITTPSPWITKIYAVNDYVFAAVRPQIIKTKTMPYLVSSEGQPSFSVGDPDGLPTGIIVGALPFFFHSGEKVFTMSTNLFVSEPGIVSGLFNSTTESDFVSPNPFDDFINVNVSEMSDWSLWTVDGVRLKSGSVTESEQIYLEGLSPGAYVFMLNNKEGKTVQRVLKK